MENKKQINITNTESREFRKLLDPDQPIHQLPCDSVRLRSRLLLLGFKEQGKQTHKYRLYIIVIFLSINQMFVPTLLGTGRRDGTLSAQLSCPLIKKKTVPITPRLIHVFQIPFYVSHYKFWNPFPFSHLSSQAVSVTSIALYIFR